MINSVRSWSEPLKYIYQTKELKINRNETNFKYYKICLLALPVESQGNQ